MLTCPISLNADELQKLFDNAKKLSHYSWKEIITIAESVYIALVGRQYYYTCGKTILHLWLMITIFQIITPVCLTHP